jgi:CBS domain-containing protein
MVQSVVDLFNQLARNEFGFFARLKSVTELMTTPVPVVSSELTLGDVVGRKDPSKLNSVAVIDSAKGDLIGLLKHSTILLCLPRYLNTLKENDRDRSILTTNVCNLVSRQSPSLSSSATLLEALEILVRQDCEQILIYDDPHQLKGMITPGSFARAMLLYYSVFQQQQALQRLRLVDLDSDLSLDEIFCRGAQTVRDVMSAPVAIASREPVATAITMMSENRVRFLVVLDDNNQVTGVVSQNDILVALQPPVRASLLDHKCTLPSMVDLLSSGQEATLSEPVTSIAKSRLITVSPTSRLPEALSRLVETDRDVVVVQDEKQLLGMVSLSDVVRVFRTLMRLQAIKG